MNEIETLHRPFAQFLRGKGIEFINARSDRESTIAPGWPDFTLIHPQRPVLLIEFKDKEGKVSSAQRECHASLAAAGFTVHVVRDLGIAIELVTQWLSTVGATPAPRHALGIHIRQQGSHGDFVCDGAGTTLRRATLDDIKTYPRK